MILEVYRDEIRDIAAAVNAARKREPDIAILADVERIVLTAIRAKQTSLELDDDQAKALRNVLLMRAYDQRNTTEGSDYADLAERIGRDLETDAPGLESSLNQEG